MSVAREFIKRFRQAVKLYGGVRATGRALDVPAPTISRIGMDHQIDLTSAQKIGPQIGVCACCGQDWPQ